ncbi:uncharacterized protein LOC118735459 isoform X1 [Rhagoletis pomonella]|uniref:uncharacterized protein LOC118735459 isoform X1 n=1 Tax=Rhagoletis pomonella TaxID=28610 RepID=UPI0017863450|nr:uncharacterized protein LOC118735459 isoform X1 [Rhagoletis pomonella]
MSPDSARSRAVRPVQQEAPAAKTTGNQRVPTATKRQPAKRCRGHPPGSPLRNSDRKRGHRQDEHGVANQNQQSSYADAMRATRIAVLPQEYPAMSLTPEQLTSLQDIIMHEVLRGWTRPLIFTGVYFRPGLLLVDCRDEATAEWLRQTVPSLNGWEGPALYTRSGDDIPPTHNVTIFLPWSIDRGQDYALGLLRAQNESLNTSLWRVMEAKVEDGYLRLNVAVDEDSFCSMRRQSFRLNYRYGNVLVKPWNQRIPGDAAHTTPTGAASTGTAMAVDEQCVEGPSTSAAASSIAIDRDKIVDEHRVEGPLTSAAATATTETTGRAAQQNVPSTRELEELAEGLNLQSPGRELEDLTLSEIDEPMVQSKK